MSEELAQAAEVIKRQAREIVALQTELARHEQLAVSECLRLRQSAARLEKAYLAAMDFVPLVEARIIREGLTQ